MQELVALLYVTFLLLECLSLLVGDAIMILLMRTASASVALLCYWLRQANTSDNHSPRRSKYYAQLLYLFACMDGLAYPSVSFVMLLLVPPTSAWLYVAILICWLVALGRLYWEHWPLARSSPLSEIVSG
jgi:hypothetical protein